MMARTASSGHRASVSLTVSLARRRGSSMIKAPLPEHNPRISPMNANPTSTTASRMGTAWSGRGACVLLEYSRYYTAGRRSPDEPRHGFGNTRKCLRTTVPPQASGPSTRSGTERHRRARLGWLAVLLVVLLIALMIAIHLYNVMQYASVKSVEAAAIAGDPEWPRLFTSPIPRARSSSSARVTDSSRF